MANWQVIKRQGGVSKGNWGKKEGINESCGLCGKEGGSALYDLEAK